MIKGCQRRMIVVQGKDKSVFETAYFVLRRESERVPSREADMLAEAIRIINENRMGEQGGAGRFRRGLWAWFLLISGCFLGCGGTLVWQALVH